MSTTDAEKKKDESMKVWRVVIPILVSIGVFLVTFFLIMWDNKELWPQWPFNIDEFFFPVKPGQPFERNMVKFYFIAVVLALVYSGVAGGATYGGLQYA